MIDTGAGILPGSVAFERGMNRILTGASRWPEKTTEGETIIMGVIQHVGLNCRDMAAQEKFYTQMFGFRRARVFCGGTPDEFLMLRSGNVCLELFPAPAATAEDHGGEQVVGFKHLAFEVDNVEQKAAELSALGLEPGEVTDCSEFAEGLKVCFFTDPEGNILEIMQNWQDDTALL